MIMKVIKTQLPLIFIFIIANNLFAINPINTNFHTLTTSDGLADNTIYCIYKDKKGFMWFGTNNGLSKYDNYQFKNYTIGNKFSIPVTKIEKSQAEDLYLLTNDWLTYFNCRNESFVQFHPSIKDQHCQITDFTLSTDSSLWACDKRSLLKLKTILKREKKDIQIQYIHTFPLEDSERFMKLCLSENRKALYLVTNHGRIFQFDTNSKKIVNYAQLPILKAEFGASSMSYQNGKVWISSMVYGIFICDPSLQQIDNLVNQPNAKILSHNDVYNITAISHDLYLAVTWYGYTTIHTSSKNPKTWTTDIYTHMPAWDTQDIETRMISSYFDPNGILWIGTHGGGIIISDRRWDIIKRYQQNCDNETNSIITDSSDRIYLATYHKGIMRSTKSFCPSDSTLQFVTIPIPQLEPTYFCAVRDKNGLLWFGNKNGRLLCYNTSNDTYTIHPLKTHTPIYSLLFDSQGRFWVGTGEGLLLFNQDTYATELVPLNQTINQILDIDEDKDGNIWVATSLGVVKIRKKETKWDIQKYEFITATNTAQAILVATDGQIYVGFKNGLGIIQPNQHASNQFLTTNEGLSSNWINCFVEDQYGNIWIGSNSGITRYDPFQQLYYNYDISKSNKSVSLFKDFIFWGGSKHLVYFSPQQAIATLDAFCKSPVFITNIEVDNQPVKIGKAINGQVILKEAITYTDQITLSHTNRNFSLSFTNLAYSNNRLEYNYRLYPYQTQWIACSNKERISYANLSSGIYTFQVKSINEKSSDKITALQIVILPHWSETWIFRSSILLFCIAIAYYFVRKFKKQQQRKEHMIHLQHELFVANMMREQEQKSKIEKETFFTQVAHELRTPLTLILAPLTEVIQNIKPAEAIYAKLVLIYKSAQSLHTLVSHLLQVQKIDAQMVKLKLAEVNILELIKRTATPFQELAQTQNIHFSLNLCYEQTTLYIDENKIESAIRNLLSNAFKYTPEQGTIMLSVYHEEKDEKAYCAIQVSDNGAGISLQDQEHIFEPFTTGNNKPNLSTAVGIGLYIVKHTISLHHGMVCLDSKENEGSKFILYIPEGNTHFINDESETDTRPSVPTTYKTIIPPTPKKSVSMTTLSVLVVEDNEDINNYITSLLDDKYRIYQASNGEEGIKIAKEILPSLIISDIMMPIKDGFEFSQEIRSNLSTAHIPIIFLTAKAEDIDIIHATHIGIDDYLTKPFNSEILKAKVDNLISQRKQLKKIYSKLLTLKVPLAEEEQDPHNQFMQQVINIIEANLTNESFNVKYLASSLNMSQPTLYRRIKENSQQSIIELIRNVRISKAASLLLLKKYSVQEIAEMVGYNDYDTFRKCFIKQFNISPSKYIKESQNNIQ